jgi:hypothetical protein
MLENETESYKNVYILELMSAFIVIEDSFKTEVKQGQ